MVRPDGIAVARCPRREPVAGDTQMKEPGTGSRQTELIFREARLACPGAKPPGMRRLQIGKRFE